MASVRHLEFENFDYMSKVHPRSGNLHLCTKFDRNWIIEGLRICASASAPLTNSENSIQIDAEYIDTFLFFRPSLNRVLFPIFCLLVEGECQILVF